MIRNLHPGRLIAIRPWVNSCPNSQEGIIVPWVREVYRGMEGESNDGLRQGCFAGYWEASCSYHVCVSDCVHGCIHRYVLRCCADRPIGLDPVDTLCTRCIDNDPQDLSPMDAVVG
jgi:hypothetical protein